MSIIRHHQDVGVVVVGVALGFRRPKRVPEAGERLLLRYVSSGTKFTLLS